MGKIKVFIVLFFCFCAVACGQQKNVITYKVKEGETMKSIAKKLDIKTRDLLKLNPNVSRRPAPNTKILIPNVNYKKEKKVLVTKDSIETKDSVAIGKTKEFFLTHKVKKGDTFYNLTRLYNVTIEELKGFNPSLDSLGLKLGSELVIKPLESADKIKIFRDSIVENNISIAMMLPFRAVEYDTIDGKDIFMNNTLANITTDLYLGAELAIDSLQKQGLQVELNLFDTGRKNQKIDSLLSVIDFDDIDAIVGPLYSDEVPKVANRANTPVVFPVYSRNQPKFNFSKIIKTYPDRSVHEKALMSYLTESYLKEKVLIIGDSSAVSIQKAESIRNQMLPLLDSIQHIEIIHPSNGYIPKHIVINALKAEPGNWVVLATDNSVIASDVINSLISLPQEDEEEEEDDEEKNKDEKDKEKDSDEPEMQILPEDTPIRIFAFDKSDTFDKIDNNKLAKLEFTFSSDVFTDESAEEWKLFNNQYLKKNKTYPSYYAVKGFDIMYDTAIRLASGNGLKETFRNGLSVRLESKFDYTEELYKTTSNRGVFILQYNPDLTLRRLK